MNQQLFDVVDLAMRDVCRASADKHSGEKFYCVALYTSGEYSYLVDSISTTEGLEKVARKYLNDKTYQDKWRTLEVAMRELKWSPCDSPYHCEFEDKFTRVGEVLDSIWQDVDYDSDEEYVNTCKSIHETCIQVVANLRNCGPFDKDQVVFNLLMGDQSDEERFLNAELLNVEALLRQFREELHIDDDKLEEMRTNRWRW